MSEENITLPADMNNLDDPEVIKIIRATKAKNLSPGQFKYFLSQAKLHGFHPLKNEIHK